MIFIKKYYKKYVIKNFFYSHIKKKNCRKYIIMVNPITHELRQIARNRGIKSYQNISREKFLSTLDESEHIFENSPQNELEQIAKMPNLSQIEFKAVTKISNLSQNELEEIVKMRRIKLQKYVKRIVIDCSFKIRVKPYRTL